MFAGNDSKDIVHIKAKPNETIEFSAKGSSDPDGDGLTYNWYQYREAGTLPQLIEIEDSDKEVASVTLGEYSRSGTFHVILEVQDDGTPSLVSYRRIVVSVEK